MRSVRNAGTRQRFVARIEGLSSQSQRQWGQMDVTTMVPHISDQIRMALGEVSVRSVRGPFRFAPMRRLIVHVMPWPKGKAKAPEEAFTTSPTQLDADKATLVRLLERFATTPEDALTKVHPLFGDMTAHDWDVLTFRHLDHHLRQFGA